MIYGTLHLRFSNGQQQSHNISQSSILIGRGLANDLILNDPAVAPSHARLSFQRGDVVLEDLGSINGTYINGVRLEARKPYVLNKAEFIRFATVDALLAPPNSAPPDWPVLAAPPPAAAPVPPPPEPINEVVPPPTPKLVSIKLEPKRSTRDFTATISRSEDDPDTATQTILLAGTDPTEDLAFTFKPQILKLDPGQSKSSLIQVRGLPGTFTITAAGKGRSYTTATKGALVAPDHTIPVILAIVVVLACLTGLLALAVCPTSLSGVCGFVPFNPIALAVSTATSTSSPTATVTATATLAPTFTAAPPSATAVQALASATVGVAAPSASPTRPASLYASGVLTFKRQQANGSFTLMAVPANGGSPVALISNKADFRVLDYSGAVQVFAVDVNEGFGHTLWLVKADGTLILQSANEGWASIRNGDFAPDGSYLILDTLTDGGSPRYYFYGLDGKVVRTLVPLTPTQTLTPSRTYTSTATSTSTATASRTPTDTVTPTASRTPSETPAPSDTPTATLTKTATLTRTPANSQTADALANPSATPTETPKP